MCLLCFSFCHCNHAAARCSQDGIIGENVCTAYFSQGLSLANYCLDGSQRFSPITCIFSPSHAWTPAKAQLALSAWCCLWQRHYWCPEKWHINNKSWWVKGLDNCEGTQHVPVFAKTTPQTKEYLAFLRFWSSKLCVWHSKNQIQPWKSVTRRLIFILQVFRRLRERITTFENKQRWLVMFFLISSKGICSDSKCLSTLFVAALMSLTFLTPLQNKNHVHLLLLQLQWVKILRSWDIKELHPLGTVVLLLCVVGVVVFLDGSPVQRSRISFFSFIYGRTQSKI